MKLEIRGEERGFGLVREGNMKFLINEKWIKEMVNSRKDLVLDFKIFLEIIGKLIGFKKV